MLFNAQKMALAEEKKKGNKQKMHTGHSWATLYRRKHHRSDLAAQGYLSVHEFMKRMKEKKKEEKLTAQQELAFEESEESSDSDAVIVSHLWTNDNIDIEEVAPAVNEDRCQVAQGPATGEYCLQIVQGPVANEDHHRVTEDCHQVEVAEGPIL